MNLSQKKSMLSQIAYLLTTYSTGLLNKIPGKSVANAKCIIDVKLSVSILTATVLS